MLGSASRWESRCSFRKASAVEPILGQQNRNQGPVRFEQGGGVRLVGIDESSGGIRLEHRLAGRKLLADDILKRSLRRLQRRGKEAVDAVAGAA